MAYSCECEVLSTEHLRKLDVLEDWDKRRDPLCFEITEKFIAEARKAARAAMTHEQYQRLDDEDAIDWYVYG